MFEKFERQGMTPDEVFVLEVYFLSLTAALKGRLTVTRVCLNHKSEQELT